MDKIKDFFWSTPVVTRTLFTATLIESVLVLSQSVNPFRVIFHKSLLFKIFPDIWRLATPFLLTSGGIGFLFDLYFLYTYGSGLELDSPRFAGPGDFFVYVAFLWPMIMLPAGFLLEEYIFTPALIMAFVYTFAQDNRGKRATFFVIQIPMEYLPWVMLLVTLVSSGWNGVMLQFCGIFASHAYDFLTRIYPTFGGGSNYVRTPNFVKRWFHGQQPTQSRSGFQTFAPSQRPAPASQSSGSGLFSGSSWSHRGTGRRLGGD